MLVDQDWKTQSGLEIDQDQPQNVQREMSGSVGAPKGAEELPTNPTFSWFAPGLCPSYKILPLALFSLIPLTCRMPLFQWQAQPRRHPARKLTVRVRSGNNQ